MPSPQELQTYYPAGYWWSERPRSHNFLARLHKRMESIYRQWVLRDHVRFAMRAVASVRADNGPMKLLDVGCSGGTFLHELSNRGVAAKGLDASLEAVSHAREVYGLDCAVGDLKHSPWIYEKFSVITCFHVLEHIPDPRDFIREVYDALATNGRLIIQVPNLRSWQFHWFGVKWYGLDPPRHLVNFTEPALERFLRESGLEIIRRKRFSLRDDAAAWVSSLFPGLDPLVRMAQRGRQRSARKGNATRGILLDALYFALYLLVLPIAMCDSLSGRGATLMVEAVKSKVTSDE